MIPTIAVIPTRYEPDRVLALVKSIRRDVDEIILLDNGHEPPLPGSIDGRGMGIYRLWNWGWEIARSRAPRVNVAILNDDIQLLPRTLRLLAHALRARPDIGVVYPDARFPLTRPLPSRIEYAVLNDPLGGREMTGFCFMLKGELDVPPFDEGYEWWYGDSQFDEQVKASGYGVARINGVPIHHVSDTESNDWARRPDLKEATLRDGTRWERLHSDIRDGRWWPLSEGVA